MKTETVASTRGVRVTGIVKLDPNTFSLNIHLHPQATREERMEFGELKQRIAAKSRSGSSLPGNTLKVTVVHP